MHLPIRYAAYSASFRREAGAAGRDTRGILRVHQFDKVEMVSFVKPDDSRAELEWLTERAEPLLQRLGLAYRVVLMSTREMGFVQARKYDLEVWAPGVERWLEVSSVSNFRDYQARRMAIRYRPEAGAKPELVHTLNGSGLALPRTVAAILETLPAARWQRRHPRGAAARLRRPRGHRPSSVAPATASLPARSARGRGRDTMAPPRRGGRVDECSGLENRRGCKPTVGSNPTPSATFHWGKQESRASSARLPPILLELPGSARPVPAALPRELGDAEEQRRAQSDEPCAGLIIEIDRGVWQSRVAAEGPAARR